MLVNDGYIIWKHYCKEEKITTHGCFVIKFSSILKHKHPPSDGVHASQ